MGASRSDAEQKPAPVCVLWHAPGSPLSVHLRKALQKRNIELRPHISAPTVTAEVLNAHKELTSDQLLVLLLVEPLNLLGASSVVEIAQRYAPNCRFWVYAEAEATPLRELRPSDLAREEVEDVGSHGSFSDVRSPTSSKGEPSAPFLRFVEGEGVETEEPMGREAPAFGSGQTEDDDDQSSSLTLSEDELSMLLDDDPAFDDDDDSSDDDGDDPRQGPRR